MPIPTINGLPPFNVTLETMRNKINELVGELVNLMVNLDSLNVVSLTADHIDAGTINANVVTIAAEDGSRYYRLDTDGIVAFNGTQNTLTFDLATGLLTLVSMLIRSTNGNEKIVIDSTGFHSYDPSGIERLTIGTTPAQGAKALIGRDTSGNVQSAYTYDTASVDGASRTGQFATAHGAYILLSDDGDVRIQNSVGQGFRAVSGTPEMSDGFAWYTIAKKSEADAAQSTANAASSAASSAQSTANSALSGLSSKADTSYVNSNFFANAAFDTVTRNLKFYAQDGSQIAIVNIP